MAKCKLKVKFMSKDFGLKLFHNVKSQTPQEAWSGVKPKVDHLRVFGSITYAHVPNQGRSKFDDRSVKHVFIDYYVNSKGYKLYNPNSEKMIVNMKLGERRRHLDFVPYFEEGDQEVVITNEFSNPPSEPLTFDEAMENKRWRQALEEEIKAIKKNDT
ncbi:Copia protein, partial [Mucuna pruriens]